MIKFLNQLSDDDKVAAIKFLITTLNASRQEHFSQFKNTHKSYAFGHHTDGEQWLVADVIGRRSPPFDYDDPDIDIQVDSIAESGAFGSQALVPIIEKRITSIETVVLQRGQRRTLILQNLLNDKTSVQKLFGIDQGFLKAILNEFLVEHWTNSRILVKQRKMLGDLSPITDTIMNNTVQSVTDTPPTGEIANAATTATLTEIFDDVAAEHDDSDPETTLNDVDEQIPTPSNQSNMSLDVANSQSDPLFVGEEADPLKIKAKPPRKAKLYTCFQCPKV